jgi:hypothetical protein
MSTIYEGRRVAPLHSHFSPVPDKCKISGQKCIYNVKNHNDDPTIVLSTYGVDLERKMLDKILCVLVGNRRYAA